MSDLQHYPAYKSHKIVWALKIKDIKQSPASEVCPGGSWKLIPAEAGFEAVTVTHAWMQKHDPAVGGYYVVYSDYYKSYSPAAAFEEGYLPLGTEPAPYKLNKLPPSPPPSEAVIALVAGKAPRVTPADIEAEIKSEYYFTADDGATGASCYYQGSQLPSPLKLLNFCVLVLSNGFTVTGESACASPENFDASIGRRIARQNAVEKMWPLLGFRLRDRLWASEPSSAAATDA